MEEAAADEELARAYGYALIGRLFFAPPDEPLRRALTAAELGNDAGELAEAWRELRAALGVLADAEIRDEYDDLFVSVGKAPVTLYTSAYAAAAAPDRHLVQLRQTLLELGLGRRAAAGEAEDHVSGLCDVMRWLIESRRGLAAEQRFFRDWLAPAVEPLCAAVQAQPRARFYRAAAAFLLAFARIETQAFELADAS